MAKRTGYFYGDICTNHNLEQAYIKSKHGKTYVHNMLINKEFDPDLVLNTLQQDFLNERYRTSDYTVFKVYEPKERLIFRLPYAPDRIAHHAIMNVLEPFWVKKISSTAYSCIKGRGITGAYKYLTKALKDKENTKYCLKADIKKFFPSLSHEVIKRVIIKHIKDPQLIKLLYEIIDSTDRCAYCREGYNLPIGNYISQFIANLVTSDILEPLRKKYNNLKVISYMDDIIVLSSNKEDLHKFKNNLIDTVYKYKLELKSNWQLFPVDSRGISFIGFRFYHNRILLRKKIYVSIMRLCKKYKVNRITKSQFKRSMASYYGWLRLCNCKGICKKIYNTVGIYYSNWSGKQLLISQLKDKSIRIYHIIKRKTYSIIQAIYNDIAIEVHTTNKKLIRKLLLTKRTYNNFNIILNY